MALNTPHPAAFSLLSRREGGSKAGDSFGTFLPPDVFPQYLKRDAAGADDAVGPVPENGPAVEAPHAVPEDAPESARGRGLEIAHERRKPQIRMSLKEQVHVVGLTGKLHQAASPPCEHALEVFPQEIEHLPRQHRSAVFCDENQMIMQSVNAMMERAKFHV